MEDERMKALEAKGRELKTLSLIARAQAYGQFGTQYDGDRDLQETLGWEKAPNWRTYYEQYCRGGIAKTLVNIKPEDTWRGDITVTVPPDDDGNRPGNAEKFEQEVSEMAKRVRLKEYMLRADKLAGIGQYSVLRLGFKEAGLPTEATATATTDFFREPVTNATELLFVSVFAQINAEIVSLVRDPRDARYGQVKEYQLTETNEIVKDISGKQIRTESIRVGETANIHASRVVHIAENLLEDEIYGTPRLECVLNHLYDLQKVTGGCAEMYWRGAFPGFSFELDPEADLDDDDLENMTEQIDSMIMGLKRYVKMQGVEVKQLAPQVSSPEKQVDTLLAQIAGASRIPKRILIGSERGELASSQDESNWDKVIHGRRETDCERWVRAVIDRLIEVGVLPFVPEYIVDWPGLGAEKDKENSEVAVNLARAIQAFVSGDGESVMPFTVFLERVLKLPHEVVETIAEELEGLDDEAEDEAEDIEGLLPGGATGAQAAIEAAVREAARDKTAAPEEAEIAVAT